MFEVDMVFDRSVMDAFLGMIVFVSCPNVDTPSSPAIILPTVQFTTMAMRKLCSTALVPVISLA